MFLSHWLCCSLSPLQAALNTDLPSPSSACVCSFIALLLPFLLLYIHSCLVFSLPGLPLFILPLSFLLLPPSLFSSLCHPPCLGLPHFHLPLSLVLLWHTKQKFSDYFSSWETLDTTPRLHRHCLRPLPWLQPRRLALLRWGERKGGGCCVSSQRDNTKENPQRRDLNLFTSLIWYHITSHSTFSLFYQWKANFLCT